MMDMTREAMEYVEQMTKKAAPLHDPMEICGKVYTNEKLYRMDEPPRAEPLHVETLTGLMDYVKNCTDEFRDHPMILHVSSPTDVDFFSRLDAERKREHLCHAVANVHSFSFGQWMGQEDFIIRIQSNFAPTADRELILQFAGNVITQNNLTYADDGITQVAAMKTGVASASSVKVPNPVTLAPYRTFQEIAQPEAQYIFRMKIDRDQPYFLLADASNGIWKNLAVENIKNYICGALADIKSNIVVIG